MVLLTIKFSTGPSKWMEFFTTLIKQTCLKEPQNPFSPNASMDITVNESKLTEVRNLFLFF